MPLNLKSYGDPGHRCHYLATNPQGQYSLCLHNCGGFHSTLKWQYDWW